MPVMQGVSFTADVEYGSNNYLADANMQNDILNLVVRSPEYINGLTLEISKDGTTAKFKGISYPIDATMYNESAMTRVLYCILNDVVDKKLIYDSENCVMDGKIDNYDYTFVFSPSGLPISLSVNDLDLYVKFSNVSLN